MIAKIILSINLGNTKNTDFLTLDRHLQILKKDKNECLDTAFT